MPQGLWSCRRGFDEPMFSAVNATFVRSLVFSTQLPRSCGWWECGNSSFKMIILRQSRRRCLRV